MSKIDAWSFLAKVRNIVTGGGREKDGTTPRLDSGYLHDTNFSVNDLIPVVTDSSGGTAGTTIAANSFKSTVIIPIQDVDLVNSATWKINIPYAFTVTSAGVRTGKPGTGASATATLTTQINGTPTTGGVITMTLASQSATGVLTAGTAITALNTGTAGQTLEFAVSSVTSFTAGDAYIEFTVTNNDLANAAATQVALSNLVSSETNLKVFQAAASTTTIASLNIVIPRDYDEATDDLKIQLGMAMSGSTDTPTVTATAYRKRPGSNIVTVATSVSGKTRSGTAVSLSSADQVVVFDFGNNGLKMDDALTIVFTAGAHTTDNVLVYFVEPVYRSCLVSFNETDSGNVKNGNPLR